MPTTTTATAAAGTEERMPGGALSLRDAVVIADAEGAVRYLSPNFEPVFGYSRFEILGKKVQDLRRGPRDTVFFEAIHEALRTGEVRYRVFAASRLDGTKRIESVTAYPVWDVLNSIHGVGIRRDMSRYPRWGLRVQEKGGDT